jgi:two-component sensor histidine kinase
MGLGVSGEPSGAAQPAHVAFDFRAVCEADVEGLLVVRASRDRDDRIKDFTFEFANDAAHRLLGVASLQGKSFQKLAAGRSEALALFQHSIRRLRNEGPESCHFVHPGRPEVLIRATSFPLDADHLAVRLREDQPSEGRHATVKKELEHRLRNLLTVVAALVRTTAKTETDVAAFANHLTARLSSLATVQGLITEAPEEPLGLPALVEAALSPFMTPQLVVDGNDIVVSADVAVPLALALHELATNSLKYGGLSVANGTARLGWRRVNAQIELEWVEVGGSPATSIASGGFGTNLINIAIKDLPQGALVRKLEPSGLHVLMSFRAE